MKAQTLLFKRALVDLDKIASGMSSEELHETVRELEAISLNAGQKARYFDERYGGGCGDQGHDSAVKALNRAGRMVWRRVFGYNAYSDISF